jgi:hypothetical protein
MEEEEDYGTTSPASNDGWDAEEKDGVDIG